MSHSTDPRRIAVVLGTRPEIIKLAKITELLGDAAYVVHTGQHYDPTLSQDFFTEFNMRTPDRHLDVGGLTRGQQIGNGVSALDTLFGDIEPAAVIVQGDTNAVAAGAMAANSRGIPLVHVEAGLRSFDRRMPEEHNRVIADHLSDLCLAATPLNVEHLANEGITGDRVVLVGNPIVEAVLRLMPTDDERAVTRARYGIEPDAYVLATFHRPENVDDPTTLRTLIEAINQMGAPVLLPLHPRTQNRIEQFGLSIDTDHLTIVDPIGYRDFIGLGAGAGLIVSDSGGVQEEVSVYKKPAVVVRRSTERQEVEGTFVTRLEVSDDLAADLHKAWKMAPERTEYLGSLPSPYGDRESPARAVRAINDLIGEQL